MLELKGAWNAVTYGGPMVYPLLVLGVIAMVIIIDRAATFARCLRLPPALLELVETYGFAWEELDHQLAGLAQVNVYGRFFGVIAKNRHQPAWWVESRAGDAAGGIEKTLNRGLWVLETIVTAAPLMGLLGTITGMMQAFKVLGSSTLAAPTEVTSGVAQALIATALGLLIAILSLFGFNFFSRMQSHALDRMERLGSRLIDHIRLDQETGEKEPAPIAVAGVREGRGGR
ncbi:MAG TPA: MotA/TolQ/ExbB proton channel family protein [Candidatus Binataceae bacterium]|nr:MotA/TolQ/ExbB proton channel family protein [Candidatus Binataceae bacterium]